MDEKIKIKFTSNKEWTEEEIAQNCKTIASGYIIGPDLDFLKKEYKKYVDKYCEEKKEFIKWIKENMPDIFKDNDLIDPDNKIANMKPEDI